jgi:hypothetical protein
LKIGALGDRYVRRAQALRELVAYSLELAEVE